MSDEVNITVHIAPNASPETLQALSDMMKCLIKAVEEGTIGIDHGKPGSDVTMLAEIKDGKVIRDYAAMCGCPIFLPSILNPNICGQCGGEKPH